MAATFIWCEDNGTQTGSPLKGTYRHGFTQTTVQDSGGANSHSVESPANCNWKNFDDCNEWGTDGAGAGRTAGSTGVGSIGNLYSAYPITAGNNSYTKYQYGKFAGSFTQISSAIWGHTAGAFGTGITLKGVVTSTYATPATAANAALTIDMTTAQTIGTGNANQTVLFSTVGPEGASPTPTLSAAGYTQYLATQLQTTGSAGAGDTTQVTLTLQYNEN